jgi:hypothetical protein
MTPRFPLLRLWLGCRKGGRIVVRTDGLYLKKAQDFILGDFRPSLRD